MNSGDLVIIKQGDTARPWTDTLTLDGAAIDLTGATVTLRMRRLPSGATLERAAAITDAAAGKVQWQPQAGDVSTPGRVALQWHIAFGGGNTLTVPTRGSIILQIEVAL